MLNACNLILTLCSPLFSSFSSACQFIPVLRFITNTFLVTWNCNLVKFWKILIFFQYHSNWFHHPLSYHSLIPSPSYIFIFPSWAIFRLLPLKWSIRMSIWHVELYLHLQLKRICRKAKNVIAIGKISLCWLISSFFKRRKSEETIEKDGRGKKQERRIRE